MTVEILEEERRWLKRIFNRVDDLEADIFCRSKKVGGRGSTEEEEVAEEGVIRLWSCLHLTLQHNQRNVAARGGMLLTSRRL